MLQPIGDRVIVEVKEVEEQTVGGIVLASNAKEKPTQGKVVAVGGLYAEDGSKLPMTVQEGDEVLYDKYSGTKVKYEGKEYLVLHEKDILAIIK